MRLGLIVGKLRLGAGSQQEPGRHLGPQLGRGYRAAGADPQVKQWRPRLQLCGFLSLLISLACVLAQLAWAPFLPPLRSSGLCVSPKGLGAVHSVSFLGRLWLWQSVERVEGGATYVTPSGCLDPGTLSAPQGGCLLAVPGSHPIA